MTLDILSFSCDAEEHMAYFHRGLSQPGRDNNSFGEMFGFSEFNSVWKKTLEMATLA